MHYLNILPDFTNNWDLAVAVFVMPIAVQWWAVWYPGAEPGGGSYIAQRMLASKSEKDALGGTLFFNVAHYVLRPWPWILIGLASLIVYPQLSDIQRAFPHLDPTLIGHDIAFPAMLRFLPVGWLGLMLGGLVAANSSTILTHLNWGASYLVHDFYRRFVKTGASEQHYVTAGRLRHHSAVRGLFGHGVRARYRQGKLQHHPAGGRRHRPALPGALVLVARHGLVRDRGHGQLVRRLGGVSGAGEERPLDRHGAAVDAHHRVYHGGWVATAYLGPAHRPAGAGLVLPQGAAVRAGLARRSRREAGLPDLAAEPMPPTSRWRWRAGFSAAS